MRVIGIDPGLQRTGYGIIDIDHQRTVYVTHGVIQSASKDPLSIRLFTLYEQLSKVFEHFHPEEAAVEETFVNANPTSTLKLGMARGVVLMVPSKYNAIVAEYSANRVKKAVVGAGHATKEQVALMVNHLLKMSQGKVQATEKMPDLQDTSHEKTPLRGKITPLHPEEKKGAVLSGDGADALAIALCHAHYRTIRAFEHYAS